MGRARNTHVAVAAPARAHDQFDGVFGTRRGAGQQANSEFALIKQLKADHGDVTLQAALAHLEGLHADGSALDDRDERQLVREFASALLVNIRPAADPDLHRLLGDLYYTGNGGVPAGALDACWEYTDSWFCDQVEMNPDAYFDGSGMRWVRDGALGPDGLLAGVAGHLAPLFAKAPMRTVKETIGGAAPYRALEQRTKPFRGDHDSTADRLKALGENQWWMTFNQLDDCSVRMEGPSMFSPNGRGANARAVRKAFVASVECAVRGEY